MEWRHESADEAPDDRPKLLLASAGKRQAERDEGPSARSVPDPWPLLILATPAAVAVWSGWVGIGQMTGFGVVRPLPGIADSVHMNTAITLPLGVEAYAAFALRAWLGASVAVSTRTRRYARWSAIGSLVLGMAGQVAYHLLTQSGTSRAPWEVTTLVSSLPVLVLGMGTALAHMLRADADAEGLDADRSPDVAETPVSAPAVPRAGRETAAADARAGQVTDRYRHGADHDGPAVGQVRDQHPDRGMLVREPVLGQEPDTGPSGPAMRLRLAQARSAAAELAASGKRVSRRTLREAGVRGSNADLASIARIVGSSRAS